jgi:uncharacterized protein (DUF2062 family)
MLLNSKKTLKDNKKDSYSQLWQKGFDRLIKIRGQPHEIALGAALGLFIGMTPFMGFQTVIAVFFAALLKWNKISAAITVWISNPLTAPLIYPVTYFVGAKLVGIEKAYNLPPELSLSVILDTIQKTPAIISLMVLGGVVLGLPIAVFGYYFSLSAVKRSQERVRRSQERIKRKLEERKAKKIEKAEKKRKRTRNKKLKKKLRKRLR